MQWGFRGIDKNTVSELCKDINDRVNALLDRPLVSDWPYLWLNALYLKQREGGWIVTVAAIIAVRWIRYWWAARGAAFRSRRARLP